MLRVFQNDLLKEGHFVVTLELVPGREHLGRALDAVMGISREAFADGRHEGKMNRPRYQRRNR